MKKPRKRISPRRPSPARPSPARSLTSDFWPLTPDVCRCAGEKDTAGTNSSKAGWEISAGLSF
jgi:hypothetical protein